MVSWFQTSGLNLWQALDVCFPLRLLEEMRPLAVIAPGIRNFVGLATPRFTQGWGGEGCSVSRKNAAVGTGDEKK